MSPSPRGAAGRGRRWHSIGKNRSLLVILLAVAALSLGQAATRTAGALTQSQISDANVSIQTAFIATHGAEGKGGNVSSLVAELDAALQLVQKAQAENATNPSQAAADLASATSIAQKVSSSAGSLGQQGASAKQDQFYTSAGSAVVIVAAASLVYAFGERLYWRVWFRLYRDYVVKQRIGG